MVTAVRRGTPMREVARRYCVALATVQLWVVRAGGERLDRVDWSSRPSGCRRPVNQVPQELEDLVLTLRAELKDKSDLGGSAAYAIQAALGHGAGAPSPRSHHRPDLDPRGPPDAAAVPQARAAARLVSPGRRRSAWNWIASTSSRGW